jgi:chromosome segregation protein
MRLSKVKLAGFKSFVDPTAIDLPSNLIGIVGPNGCGKSNIIDAVRWVMGESSAKHLRGDAMADVIFSGSSARKPVGHATIELVFDNADGQAGGQYASYSEIAVKRTVSRDGTSQYFLNGARCRRRDVTDIFLGTGLGPRSYAIIAQDMISRLIEAKPEELRVFLEEAAGISKYKERRRETENRIRHTKENIDRLNDLRDEIDKQLKHLQRQARAAERYQEMKREERKVRAAVLALRWRELDSEVHVQDREIGARETALEAATAEQRRVENALVQGRERHEAASETFSAVQARYYQKGADMARHEQALQHARDLRQRQQADVEETARALDETKGQVTRDAGHLQQLTDALREIEPQVESAAAAETRSAAALAEAEAAMEQWQQGWNEFTQTANAAGRTIDVERTRIEHVERQLKQALERRARVHEERAKLRTDTLEDEIRQLDAQASRAHESRQRGQESLKTLSARLDSARDDVQSLADTLHALRSRYENGRGRLASLEELQQAALGKSQNAVMAWLDNYGWADNPRVAERMRVAPGWERAVETVLGFRLEAVCVDALDENTPSLETLENGKAMLVETREGAASQAGDTASRPRLGDKVEGPAVLQAWLAPVHVADDLAAARAIRERLQPHESVITRAGVWLGAGWARIVRDSGASAGMLAREQEINALQAELKAIDSEIAAAADRQETLKQEVKALEAEREAAQSGTNRAHREHAEAGARLDACRTRREQINRRSAALTAESTELDTEAGAAEAALQQARGRLERGLEDMRALEARRAELTEAREQRRGALEGARAATKRDRERARELSLKFAERRSARASTERGLERMRAQLAQLETRHADLERDLAASVEPLEREQAALNQALRDYSAAETELGEARTDLEAVDAELRELERDRLAKERAAEAVRGKLESLRLASQEIRVRRKTLAEQLAAMDREAAAVLAELAEDDASAGEWEERLDALGRRIERLGAINLAAIEEFAEQSERKQYLDAQLVDLSEALATLETAIHKIDRETRGRFKETFERVNAGLQAGFPRLFGGGRAYLELTGEDLLDAGVAIMARPPGKRNSTIHLLSGGEKALTAVALVFAIFELNPAPFCLLDEVDAPLDETSVGRFCELVRDMSKRIQFLFITHNKITMEMASHLTGVTMNEPGVSRLVTVDVDEAARMAVG